MIPSTCRPVRSLLAALILGGIFAPWPASARTWRIAADGTGDAAAIQAGIDSAAVGDTVLVGPGTYYENILFRGRDIVLKSETGPEATVIHGSPTVRPSGLVGGPIHLGLDTEGAATIFSPQAYTGTVVSFESQKSPAAVVEGFTVTGGRRGFILADASPTLRNNLITENDDPGSGGFCAGIMVTGTETAPSHVLITDNIIANNRSGATGCAVFCGNTVVWIIGNQIRGNRTELGDGAGVCCNRCKTGSEVSGNTIEGNEADDRGGGVFVFGNLADDFVTVDGNLIVGNVSDASPATGLGGGVSPWRPQTA